MKKLLFTLLCTTISTISFAQNVGIGNTTPDASAMLDVSSTNKGFLMPRMTTAQRNAIASPVVGLQIFNLDDQCTDLYDGANWIKTCGLKVTGNATDPYHPTPNSWVRRANFGGTARISVVGFSIGSKEYIGMGTDGSNKNDFWEYDPATNAWTQRASFLGTARSSAVGFSIGSKGYIGTGWDGSYKNDFWEYDPATNAWTQKTNFGGMARNTAVGFSIGSKGYIGTGWDGSYKNDFWEYDPATNAWTQKTNFGGMARRNAVGFSIGNKGYIGTGLDGGYKNDFWEYDPVTNAWTQKTNFGGTARYSAVGFSIGNKGYIGTGSDGSSNKNDFWEYDPATNAWTQKANFGGTARYYAVGFSIGNKGYIGTGIDGSSYKNDFWEFMDNNISGIAYSSNLVSTTLVNSVSDGAWTLANGTVYNSNSGNVGIGTTAPDRTLTVKGNGVNNELISLKNSTGTTKYHWNLYGGGFNLAESGVADGRIYVKDTTGYVGIGTTTPNAKLNVTGGLISLDMNKYLTINPTDNFTFDSKPVGHYSLGWYNDSWSSSAGPAAWFSAWGGIRFFTGGTNRMNIDANGNVGIGTSSPLSQLHIVHAGNYAANDWSKHGLAIWSQEDGFGMKLQMGTDNDNNVSYIQSVKGNVSATKLLLNPNGGNVGIGIPNPTVPLEIGTNASANYAGGNVFDTPAGNYAGVGAGNRNISIRANGDIVSTAFCAESDSRIKNIRGLSLIENDLATINKLKVTDYTFKDIRGKGNQLQKGFIAQEVEKIIPEAISISTGYIPNIYAMSEKVVKMNDNHTAITTKEAHSLIKGDKVRLMVNNQQQDYTVTGIANATTFEISEFKESVTKVFVYGKQVNDFHAVDYDRIFTTGIGAIQELSNQVDELKAANESMQKELKQIKAQLGITAQSAIIK